MYVALGAAAANGSPDCPKPIRDYLLEKRVPYRVSTDPDWSIYATTYNIRLPCTPCIIIIPETSQHISDAVVCARQHGIKVQAKSGGHSYASFSTGGVDGAMVIDLEKFQEVKVDENGVAKVGGGVRLGPLSLAVYEQGNRALAHGTCSAVGIGGHYTHGGYGHFSRAWGLAMDQIVGLDVILADGSFVHADFEENSDIYYVSGHVSLHVATFEHEPNSLFTWRSECDERPDGSPSLMATTRFIRQTNAI
jgi:FAD/FMN-containing dehydrogenase